MQKYLKELTNVFFLIYEKNKENILFRLLLSIASIFYCFVYKLRLLLYKLKFLKTERLGAIVISIGNITCGGTGKTPLTIEVAKHLLNKGYKVAIISRGYKRKITSTREPATILVSDGKDIFTNYDLSGDEPYLIAKKVPKAMVLVNNNKMLAAKGAIRLGAEVIILDDGYQYIKLIRDENILLFDAYHLLNNGHLLPRGKLRETVNEVKRASAIILLNTEKAPKENYFSEINKIKKVAKGIPIFYMNYKITEFHGLNIKTILKPNEISKLKVIAFSGIANPDSFLNSLKENNIQPVEFIIYPDHYTYSFNDIKHIVSIAKRNNIENIITTEKDSVKIEELCEAVEVTFWSAVLELYFNTLNPFDEIFVNKKKWLNIN